MSPPANTRKRGRPCKEKPESDLRQEVSGVIVATFEAGYIVNVKIENTGQNYQGVVFKPNRVLPITPENDIAPHLPMIAREGFGETSQENKATIKKEEIKVEEVMIKREDIKLEEAETPLMMSAQLGLVKTEQQELANINHVKMESTP